MGWTSRWPWQATITALQIILTIIPRSMLRATFFATFRTVSNGECFGSFSTRPTWWSFFCRPWSSGAPRHSRACFSSNVGWWLLRVFPQQTCCGSRTLVGQVPYGLDQSAFSPSPWTLPTDTTMSQTPCALLWDASFGTACAHKYCGVGWSGNGDQKP